jgi:signal transduction histidine kinase/ActR/RegA family two-component response regulator
MQTSPDQAKDRHGLTLVASLTLVSLVTLSLIGLVVARRVVMTQDRRLFAERAKEAAVLLSGATHSAESYLPILGAIGGRADDASSTAAFAIAAASLSEARTTTLAVVAPRDGSPTVVAAVGPSAVPGMPLIGDRLAVVQRALAAGAMVSGIIHDGVATKLMLAEPAAQVPGVVAFRETLITPQVPVPAEPGSAFQELRASVYAAERPTADTLILTTEESPNLPGHVQRMSLSVGADRWTLLLSARRPLVANVSRVAPYVLLGVGLLIAVLAAGVIEVLARRRRFAEDLVEQRTRALRAARIEADKANEAKNEFLSRMSHELRTPLNAVLGFGQLLEMDPLTPEQRSSVAQIMRGGRHLLDLINEVLDISRIESGHIALSPEPVEVDEVIASAMAFMAPVATQAGITMRVESAGDAGAFVFADRQRVQQILLNLLSNAVKYNRRNGTVVVDYERVDNKIRIDVSDEGPGIADKDLVAVFAPVERPTQSETAVEGTGIGLSLSRQLAEAMQGSLDVTSTVGAGSTFSLTLPRAEPPSLDLTDSGPTVDTSAPSGTPVSTAAGARTILHVEDNPANLELVERILSRRPNLALVGAADGHAGLEAAWSQRPALVLLDLHLPDMDGAEVLRTLKADPRTADIPVIIVTADGSRERKQRLLRAGAAGYLSKPVDVGRLMKLIDKFADATYVPGVAGC